MSEIKSPSLVPDYYSDEDRFPVDYAKMQRKVVLRAARIRPESRSSLLWGFAINCVLWALLIMGGRWIYLLLR